MTLRRAIAVALAFGLAATGWSAWTLVAADRAIEGRGLAILAIVGTGAVFGGLTAALSVPMLRRRLGRPVAILLLAVVAYGAWTLACMALMIPVYAWGSYDAYRPAWEVRPIRQVLNVMTTAPGMGAIFLPQLMGLAAPALALALGLILGSRSTRPPSAARAPRDEERP